MSQQKPLLCAKRDRDPPDVGKQGEITTNLEEVDAIVRGARKKVNDRMAGCMESAIEAFFDKLKRDTLKQQEYATQAIYGQMVYDPFSKTADSVGAPDGWHPKQVSLPSRNICGNVAIMLNQIEEGAPWPRPATHARVVYIEQEGIAIGEVMSYKPLTITAPIYRCWATMRLATLEEWGGSWSLQEMYGGIPEMGVVDAWHEALTRVEELKLEGETFVWRSRRH